MADSPPPQVLSEVACQIARWLESESVPFVLIGGMAVSLAGRPRVTQDIDILASVNEERWAALAGSGKPYGLLPRTADPVAFAQDTRVLPMRHEMSGIDVDIVLAGMPLEDTGDRSRPSFAFIPITPWRLWHRTGGGAILRSQRAP